MIKIYKTVYACFDRLHSGYFYLSNGVLGFADKFVPLENAVKIYAKPA